MEIKIDRFDFYKARKRNELEIKVFLEKPFHYALQTDNVGLDRKVVSVEIFRPQLILAGLLEFYNYKSIQLFGLSEILYLNSLSIEDRKKAFSRVIEYDIPCIVIANDRKIDDELAEMSKERNIPIFLSKESTIKTFSLIYNFLSNQFAEFLELHGTFIDIFGVGVMFIGESAIGKSEVALDLVERGHRLVADDSVIITKTSDRILMGTSNKISEHFMEIRGLGFINIKELFGRRAVRHQKRLEIVVELIKPPTTDEDDFDRHGLDVYITEIMDVKVNYIRIPVYPGRNIGVIAEALALNYLAKEYGYDSSYVLSERQKQIIIEKSQNQTAIEDRRTVSWFQCDEE